MADFAAVQPGTAPAAALVLRGPDPDIVSAVGTNFQAVVSSNCGERAGRVANQRVVVAYSTVSGQFCKSLFTRDDTLLNSAAHRVAVNPAKFDATVEQLVIDGMTPANATLLPYTPATFVSASGSPLLLSMFALF